jgi:hypothetical protein
MFKLELSLDTIFTRFLYTSKHPFHSHFPDAKVPEYIHKEGAISANENASCSGYTQDATMPQAPTMIQPIVEQL